MKFDEDDVYSDSDAELDLVERSWRWADLNPERAKASAEDDEPSTT